MILNTYAVLDMLTSGLRIGAALLLVVLAVPAIRTARGVLSADRRKQLEDRNYLLLLLAGFLLVVNLLSWPLFYWLLQSYVHEWPGVMCIYGVTKIGQGSLNASRHLPGLLAALQVLKPAVVFAGGAWFVLYWANRHTQTAPLLRRVLTGALVVGVLSLVDATAEASYLLIPKQEDLPVAGCCTAASGPALSDRLMPGSWLAAAHRDWLSVIFYGMNLLMATALSVGLLRRRERPPTAAGLGLLLIGGLLSLPLAYLFLVEIAAPAILHLPFHHCAYDLLGAAPESVLGIGLFVLGVFSIGWACVAAWLARVPETMPLWHGLVDRALFLALFGYVASTLLITSELLIA